MDKERVKKAQHCPKTMQGINNRMMKKEYTKFSMRSRKVYVGDKEKVHKVINNHISDMLPSDRNGSPDESFFGVGL